MGEGAHAFDRIFKEVGQADDGFADLLLYMGPIKLFNQADYSLLDQNVAFKRNEASKPDLSIELLPMGER